MANFHEVRKAAKDPNHEFHKGQKYKVEDLPHRYGDHLEKIKESLDADPQSMDNRRLSAIARNPNHPQATHAKAELARRKVEKAEMDEGGMKRIATTQSNKADRMASGGKKGLETFKKKVNEAATPAMKKEKTLTPAEIRKRDKIAKAIKRDDPDMPMDKKMAIATATAKRVAEVSSKTLSNYMRKSAADAGKPRQSARTQDKRIGGQKMADDKLRKMQGKGSAAKVAATEDVNEAATPAMKKAADELNSYAKKSGGIDKADFMKAAKMLSSGKAGMALIKFVDGQDTEVYEKIIRVMAKHMGKQTVEKMFKVKIREEVELEEALTDNYKDAHGKAEKHHRSMAHKHWKAMDAAKENGDHEAAEAHGDQGYEHSVFADRHKHEARHGASRGQARTFKRLAREGGMVTKKSKAMNIESVNELDEDLTHQTVKPPSHTKKYSGKDSRDTNSIGGGGNKSHTVTSSQADAHDKTAAHHIEVADAHTKAGEKSSSPTLQRLHHQASVHHKKAAEAHFNASHSSSGADKDGSIQKKAKDMHMAYHLTMHANNMSQEARNKGTKAKRMNIESVNELSKDTMQSYWDKTKGDDAFSGSRKANNRLKGAINVTTKLDRLKKMVKKK